MSPGSGVPFELEQIIRRTIKPEAQTQWLQHPIPALDDQAPHELIRAGRAGELIQLLRSLNSGYGG